MYFSQAKYISQSKIFPVFFIFLQDHRFESIGGVNLDYTMYSILITFALGQILLLMFWWSHFRTYIKNRYPSIKWRATILGSFFLVIFIGLEKIKVNHQLNLAEAERLEFYDKLNSSSQDQQQINREYKKVCHNCKDLKERSKRIGKEV